MDLSKLGGGIDEAGGDTGGGEPIRILPEGRGAGPGACPAERVMADALLKLAGELSLQALEKKRRL